MEDIARRKIDELSENYILFLDLHVTSLTPALIATLNVCRDRIIDVYIKLCYYDKKQIHSLHRWYVN